MADTEKDDRPKTRNRLILYVILAMVGFAMGTLQADMFPTPMFYRWLMFCLGLVNAIALAIRGYIDKTPSDEDAAAKKDDVQKVETVPGKALEVEVKQ